MTLICLFMTEVVKLPTENAIYKSGNHALSLSFGSSLNLPSKQPSPLQQTKTESSSKTSITRRMSLKLKIPNLFGSKGTVTKESDLEKSVDKPLPALDSSLASALSEEWNEPVRMITSDEVFHELNNAIVASSLIANQLKDGTTIMKKLENIKDQFTAHQTELKKCQSIFLIQSILWDLRKHLIVFQQKASKLKKETFSTSSSRYKRLSLKLQEVYNAWYSYIFSNRNNLLMNVICQGNLTTSQNAISQNTIAVSPSDSSQIENMEMAKTVTMEGYKLLFGYGTAKSPERAFKYFLDAAKFGLPEACNILACLYECGLGTNTDLNQALEWVIGIFNIVSKSRK